MKKFIGVALLAFFLTACGEPKIDASSEQALQESLQKVRAALPAEKLTQFNDAVQTVVFSQMSLQELMQAGMTNNDSVIEAKMNAAIDGKTAEEIIKEATLITQQRNKQKAPQ